MEAVNQMWIDPDIIALASGNVAFKPCLRTFFIVSIDNDVLIDPMTNAVVWPWNDNR